MVDEEIVLQIKDVTIKKDDFTLEHVSAQLPAGYLVVVTGDNGAGKSTLLSFLTGKIKNYDGKVLFCGKELEKNREAYRNETGVVVEEPIFFVEKTPLQNEEILSGFYEKWDSERFHALLKHMSVSVKTPVGKLSRGNYVKFQLAWAMSHKAKFYIMDEPTAGLDPVFRVEFLQILQEIIEEGSTVLLATNLWSDFAKVADYRLHIEHGRVKPMEVCDGI